MTCNFSNELLGYLDNEIGAKPCTEIGLHLKGCPECRNELEALKETQTLWRNTLGPHALAPNFHIRVKNRVSRTIFRRWLLKFALAGAAAVWILIVTLVLVTSSGKNPPVPQDSTASVGTSGNKIATRTDKQPTGLDQPVTNTPVIESIAMQTEKAHFHILHKKHPMLSIFVKISKRDISRVDPADLKETIKELTKLLADKDAEVRAVAAASLGELNARESIPELVKLLNDKYAGARGWAAITLVELGAKDKVSKEASDDIKRIRDNSDENYRARAQDALKELGIIE